MKLTSRLNISGVNVWRAAVACAWGLALALGFALAVAFAETRKGRAAPRVLKRGRIVYRANCARCHGGDGKGWSALGEKLGVPNLTDAVWQSRRDDARLRKSVAGGLGNMPPFAGKLTRAEIAAAVAYVRTLKKPPE